MFFVWGGERDVGCGGVFVGEGLGGFVVVDYEDVGGYVFESGKLLREGYEGVCGCVVKRGVVGVK